VSNLCVTVSVLPLLSKRKKGQRLGKLGQCAEKQGNKRRARKKWTI